MDVARSPTVAVVVAAAATLFPIFPLISASPPLTGVSTACRVLSLPSELLEHDRRLTSRVGKHFRETRLLSTVSYPDRGASR